VLNLLWKVRLHIDQRVWNVRQRIDQRGQGMVEYALILVLVAVVVIAVLGTMGKTILAKFTQINAGLNGAGG
jgi:pilus assembly protein Flp/PilA